MPLLSVSLGLTQKGDLFFVNDPQISQASDVMGRDDGGHSLFKHPQPDTKLDHRRLAEALDTYYSLSGPDVRTGNPTGWKLNESGPRVGSGQTRVVEATDAMRATVHPRKPRMRASGTPDDLAQPFRGVALRYGCCTKRLKSDGCEIGHQAGRWAGGRRWWRFSEISLYSGSDMLTGG